MPQFRYVARNSEGKLVEVVVTCNDRGAAIRQVEQQRFVPIKIEPVEKANGHGAADGAPKAKTTAPKAPGKSSPDGLISPVVVGPVDRMSHAQQYLFTEQLAHLLTSGMTLDEVLNIL